MYMSTYCTEYPYCNCYSCSNGERKERKNFSLSSLFTERVCGTITLYLFRKTKSRFLLDSQLFMDLVHWMCVHVLVLVQYIVEYSKVMYVLYVQYMYVRLSVNIVIRCDAKDNFLIIIYLLRTPTVRRIPSEIY